jgi:hypothetical protein
MDHIIRLIDIFLPMHLQQPPKYLFLENIQTMMLDLLNKFILEFLNDLSRIVMDKVYKFFKPNL